MSTAIALVVPISVEAICIGKDSGSSGAKFLRATTNFAELPDTNNPKPYISSYILQEPFSGDQDVIDEGIHLHWALPDALTHGTQSKNGIEYPIVPNRWLVTRIGSQSSRQSWVIESDLLSKNNPNSHLRWPGSVTIPIDPEKDSPQRFRYLGKVYKYEDWKEKQKQKETNLSSERDEYLGSELVPHKLTAIGYGEPTFAAYYPNCATVFGFYDSADSLSESDTLTYQVVGWYSNSEDDPLQQHQPDTCSSEKACKQEGYKFYPDLEWMFPSTENPTLSLYSGLIRNITWNRNTSYFSKALPQPQITIGNTASEALSALIAQIPEFKEFPDLETKLNKLQLDLLDKENQSVRQTRFEQELFQSYFGSLAGGSVWSVTKADSAVTDTNEITLSDNIANDLNDLNQSQQEYDTLIEKRLSYQQQIFSDWCKFSLILYKSVLPSGEAESIPDFDLSAVTSFIKKATAQVSALKDEITTKQQELEKKQGDLNNKLGSNFILRSVVAPRYWQANDPVILFSGPAVEPALRYGGDGRLRDDGFLECWVTNQLAEGFKVSEVAKDLAIPEDKPSIAVKDWQTPWLPFILQWETKYEPIQEIRSGKDNDATYKKNYESEFITTRFRFIDKETVELEFGSKSELTQEPEPYTGSIILTPHIKNTLESQISKYLESHSDDELKKVRDYITRKDGTAILSQALSGLTHALIMLEQVLQLKVYDSKKIWSTFNKTVSGAVDSMNLFTPRPLNNYNPIRAGYLKITNLWLVDAFGRIMKIEPGNDIIRPQNLLPTNQELKNSGYITLTPRLVQPSRLLFRWLSASDDNQEMNDHPATTPIFGWIIPNHLDNSLAIYNNQGTAIGSFIIRPDETLAWKSAPDLDGADDHGINDVAQVFSHENNHLKEWAIAISQNGESFLKATMQACDNASTLILPENSKQDPSTAVLIGRPLALVRASLKLDIKGLPAYNQSWQAFNDAVKSPDTNEPIRRDTADFEKVKFPVRLGNLTNVDDGLIGYYLPDSSNKTAYNKFYTLGTQDTNGNVCQPTDTTITLDCNPFNESDPSKDSDPYVITMLIDPHAKIHATTGILPVKAIEIPPDQYTSALQAMNITFLIAPILSDSDTGDPNKDKVSLPIPHEGGGEWKWLEKMSDGSSKTSTKIVEDINQKKMVFNSPQSLKEGWLQWSQPVDKGTENT